MQYRVRQDVSGLYVAERRLRVLGVPLWWVPVTDEWHFYFRLAELDLYHYIQHESVKLEITYYTEKELMDGIRDAHN